MPKITAFRVFHGEPFSVVYVDKFPAGKVIAVINPPTLIVSGFCYANYLMHGEEDAGRAIMETEVTNVFQFYSPMQILSAKPSRENTIFHYSHPN